MSKITTKDYKSILSYYNKPIPSSTKQLKENAEKILAEKLCRCIKKVDPINEAKSIGICTKTVFNSRGLTRGAFTCTGKRKVEFRKINKKTQKKKTQQNKKMKNKTQKSKSKSKSK